MHKMQRITSLLIFLCCLPSLALAQWTIDDTMRTKLINLIAVSPDGKKVVYLVVNHTKINGLWQDDTQL